MCLYVGVEGGEVSTSRCEMSEGLTRKRFTPKSRYPGERKEGTESLRFLFSVQKNVYPFYSE